MRVNIFSAKGVKTESKLELPEKIFEVKPHATVLRQYIHVYQKIQRAGTVATKTRGQVSGGGRKPWAQKGTGRARHGSVRSPIWVGGGKTFGPQPRTFEAALPKKVKDLALRSALSAKAAAGLVYVVADPVFKEPKTSQARELLAKLKTTQPLVVLSEKADNIRLSFRNLVGVETIEVADLNPYAVLAAKEVVFFKEGLGKLKDRLIKEEVKAVKTVKAKRAVSRKPKAVSRKREESKK
ncbi:MAG: 50S ribosomal protein L4 [Patescibacteria group bacterium]